MTKEQETILKTMKKLLLMITMLFSLIACKKYDENKGIQLKSPEKRLEGVWKWKSNENIIWTFNSDKTCSRQWSGNGINSYYVFNYHWSNDKTSIIIDYSNKPKEIKILKLTNKEVHFNYLETINEDVFMKQ